MAEEFLIYLAGKPVQAVRWALKPSELCFPLQLTKRQVNNAKRRGEFVWAGQGKLDAESLCEQLAEREDLLPIEFIRGWAEGRFEMPSPAAVDEKPSPLYERLDLLDRPKEVGRP